MYKINLLLFIKIFVAQTVLFLTSSNAAPQEGSGIVLSLPDECKDQRYCSIKPAGFEYMEDNIKSALPEFLSNSDEDEYNDDNVPENLTPVLSSQEYGQNCPYVIQRQQIYFYQIGRSNKSHIIVQTKNFKQYVETVQCLYSKINMDSEVQCLEGVGLSHFNMKSSCVTLTARRELYVYDSDNSRIIRMYFEFPASCSCLVFHKT